MLLSMTPVTNTTAFPASAVVQIEATFPNGQHEIGTGTMVNQNTVLTAGHMVYNYLDGGWAKSVEVIAARNGNSTPYGIAYATHEETFNSFIADNKNSINSPHPGWHDPGDGDIGFISLDRDLGTLTGSLGFMGTSPGATYYVNKYGYPGELGYNGSQMYHDFGALNENAPGSVSGFGYWGWSTSSMSSIGGESGSSLILDLNGQMGIIGVQDIGPASGSGEGYAEVTTQGVVNALANFERAFPPTGITGSPPPASSPPTALALPMPSDPPMPSSPPASSPPSVPTPPASSPPSVPSPQAPSPVQLYLDGITLAMDLSETGGLSAALADAALMQDIDAAAGGFLNPYLDAGFSAALSALHGSRNG